MDYNNQALKILIRDLNNLSLQIELLQQKLISDKALKDNKTRIKSELDNKSYFLKSTK